MKLFKKLSKDVKKYQKDVDTMTADLDQVNMTARWGWHCNYNVFWQLILTWLQCEHPAHTQRWRDVRGGRRDDGHHLWS